MEVPSFTFAFPGLQEFVWNTLLMLYVAAPAAGARVLLQWAVDITTRPPMGRALVLFLGSMLAAVTAGHVIASVTRLAGWERLIAALVGFLAQDAFVAYAARKAAWQRDPGRAIRDVRRWIGGVSDDSSKDEKKSDKP